jgi:hypothetical protein
VFISGNNHPNRKGTAMKKQRTPRKINWFIIGLIGLPLLAVGAYLWVTNLMSSAQAYRSPLANTPPAAGQALGTPVTHRLVFILVDALRYDTSLNTQVMPFLNELRAKSATAVMHSQPPSFSDPAWATLLTGAWPYINDSELFNPADMYSARTLTQDNIFAAADRAGLNSGASGYEWLRNMLANSGVDDSFYVTTDDNTADVAGIDAGLPWLNGNDQFLYYYIDQVDYAGHHEGGPRSPNWNAAASRADNLVRKIVSNLDLTMDTVIIVSDHGQIDRGGHGGPDPITLVEPFIMAGAGVIPGSYGDIQMVDVAPTMAALLGTSIPASNQGHVLTDMLTLTPEQNVAIQDALKAQQAQLFTAYTRAINSTASIGSGDPVTATQFATSQARLTRLGTERIWRNMLAAFLAFMPGYLLFLRKDKKNLWLLAGAALFVLLFNLRWAFIDGRTYSLASIEGVTWLIVYCAITSVVAVIIGWLVSMFGLRAFKTSPRQAAGTALGYVWFTLYLLALPILLSFALNGFTVTWTLPEWYTLFVALLSLIQSLVVAAFGMLLVGISALIGKLAVK